MNPSTDTGIVLSWQRASIAWQQGGPSQGRQNIASLDVEDDGLSQLPELPDASMQVQTLYLPMEQLLSRAIHFPFDSAALVDADMLFQTLSDEVDAKADEWWLAWHLEPCQDGVAGMVFGLSEALRTEMQNSPHWGQAKMIVVDGFERLQQHRISEQAAAIIDQDDEGLFFGYFDGEAWRGMRRLNGSTSSYAAHFQILQSLEVMGFDMHHNVVLGIADENTWQIFQDKDCDVQGDVVAELNSRHEANLATPIKPSTVLNFRHGRWSARLPWQRFGFWQRSVMMLLLLGCVWLGGTWYQIQQIDAALETSQQRIEAAFHRALPNEKVMLDALAQLKQAAGGNQTTASLFLPDLEIIGQVYQKQPWQLDSLNFRDEKMEMSGHVSDIAQLNQLQESLQNLLHRDVSIVDTQMAEHDVSFRMRW